MGIHYEWHNDIAICTIEAPWTWEEYDRVGAGMSAEIAQIDAPVANIIDITRMGAIPPGNPLAHLQKTSRALPKNLYLSVLVGAPYGATIFMDILFRLQPESKQRARFVKTMDDALALIEQRSAEGRL